MVFNRIVGIFTAIFLSLLIGPLSSAPLSLTQNLFSLKGENVQSIAINQTFSDNSKTDVVTGTTITSGLKSAIYGASVDAKIKLFGEASVVRVILIDNEYNEYMIYEINSLLADSYSFSIQDVCHETKLLNAINPMSLRVDLLAASIELQNVSFVTTMPCTRNEIATLQDQIKTEQQEQRIDLYNKQIKLKGEEWLAGPTEISMKTYQEKKCYFLGGENNPLPNTQGTEYYAGGVMPSRTNVPELITEKDLPKTTGVYPDTFDWRNRHGATNSASPYFNSATGGKINGWCTPIRNQGSCGSCWVFAGVGDAEQKFNLYYNRHIDIDLSEQYVGACGFPNAICNGGMPSSVEKYLTTKGVIDEAAFPYKGSNTPQCGDSSSTIKEHAFLKTYKNLKNAEVFNYEDLKKCIIKYGPCAGTDMSISHAMTVVGYRSKGTSFTIIYKNSWGGSGDGGYMYKASPYAQSSWVVFICTTAVSINGKKYTDDSIRCVDQDKDGYYNWGIGSKPKTCPECPSEKDCDDNNPNLGPYIDSSGICKPMSTAMMMTKLPNSGLNYNYSFNPIHRVAVIRFEIPDNTRASVTIYTLSGTFLKTLAVNDEGNGLHKAVWNGANESGSPVSKGIYVCRISVDNADAVTTSSFKIAAAW